MERSLELLGVRDPATPPELAPSTRVLLGALWVVLMVGIVVGLDYLL